MLRILIRASVLIGAILSVSVDLVALNPSHRLDQYGHTAWTLAEGLLAAYPRALTQTADGYLWLAAESTLMRFDGVRFSPSPTPAPWSRDTVVTALHGARDGSLWVGTSGGMWRLKDGVFTAVEELKGQYVAVIEPGRDGQLWAGTNGGSANALLCAVDDTGVDCQGRDGKLGRFILSLHHDSDARLWIGASNGLWIWQSPQLTHFEPPPTSSATLATEIVSIISTGGADVVTSTNRELWRQGRARGWERSDLEIPPDVKVTVLLRDRDGGLWIGTQNHGLLRERDGGVERFSKSDRLSGDFVLSLFEDREGSVWVGTLNGLDRFRDVVSARISTKHGLVDDTVVSVNAARDGGVWLGTAAGLNRWKDGRITRHAVPAMSTPASVGSLFEDRRGWLWVASLSGLKCIIPERWTPCPVAAPATRHVHAIVEDGAGTLWISDQNSGLIRWHPDRRPELVPWSTFDGRAARALATDPAGGLWLGFIRGGVAYFRDNRVVRTLRAGEQVARGRVNALLMDRDGILWVATQNGLSAVSEETTRTLSAGDGLPCGAVQWVVEDDARALWLHTGCGLVRIDRDQVVAWMRQGATTMRSTVYDAADGVLRYADLGGYGPKVSKGRDGRIWFATYDGVGVVDPQRLPNNRLPPAVAIEGAVADRVTYPASPSLRIGPGVRDLRIDYTALSLVAPQKNRFRYKLEGRDVDWVDAGDRRQAFYADLRPGDYQFRVVAANDRGVWNEIGGTWAFSIAPAFYQTAMFRALLAGLLMLLPYSIYRWNMRRLATQLTMRFEERLAERTRIAQDLHDTLLQGFVSSSMQLHLLAGDVADPGIHSRLTRIVDRIGQILEEARQAVTGLRTAPPDDLQAALLREAEHFRGERQTELQVSTYGSARGIDSLTRDAAYQIGREALSNVFRHADATKVIIEVEFGSHDLVLSIRDNGRGMDARVLEVEPIGHWGIRGMRDRAEATGIELALFSRPGLGTEVRLRIRTESVDEIARPSGGWWPRRK